MKRKSPKWNADRKIGHRLSRPLEIEVLKATKINRSLDKTF